jgi:glycosyltransferase involved in cell wall biosynthesis
MSSGDAVLGKKRAISNCHPAQLVLLFSEARLHVTPDGRRVVATDVADGPLAWRRHIQHLEGSHVAARLGPVTSRAGIPMDEVPIYPLPFYQGPRQLIRRLPMVVVGLWRAVGAADFCVLRLPGVISLGAGVIARLRRRPFAIELVGDPVSLLASGSIGEAAARLARVAGAFTRWVVSGALLGRYVTAEVLQRLYPLRAGAPAYYYSNVHLGPEDFVHRSREVRRPARHLIAVGTQDQMYKGQDDLIRAFSMLDRKEGYSLTIIGDGRLHQQLRGLAAALKVDDRVRFLGRINDRQALRAQLDAADIFIQPSRTEGLPRALIEAMARGLPAIGTDVGGTSELLPASQLVPPAQPRRLAVEIERLAASPTGMTDASRCALETSRKYATGVQETRVAAWMHALESSLKSGST